MFKRLAMIVLLSSQLSSVAAAEQLEPPLRGLEAKLRHQLTELRGVDFSETNAGRTLQVTYNVRQFQVYGRTKSGSWSRDPHQVTGPSNTGFVLRVHLQDAGTVNQAVVPQTIREPYWSTDLDVVPLDKSNSVYVAFSYGRRLDQNLPKQLAAFWATTRSKAEPGEVGVVPSRDGLSTLEGILKKHPKFSYRYYLDGLANGQSCGLTGGDNLLNGVELGTRVRVRGVLRSKHFDKSDYDRPNSAIIVADYLFMEVKQLVPLGEETH